MTDLATLRRGRKSFEQRAWAESYRLLQAADQDPDALFVGCFLRGGREALVAKVESTVTIAQSVDIESDTEVRRRPRTSTLALAGIIGPIWFTTLVVLQGLLLPDYSHVRLPITGGSTSKARPSATVCGHAQAGSCSLDPAS